MRGTLLTLVALAWLTACAENPVAVFDPEGPSGLALITNPPGEFEVGPFPLLTTAAAGTWLVRFASTETWRITKVRGASGGKQTVTVQRTGSSPLDAIEIFDGGGRRFCVDAADDFVFNVFSTSPFKETLYVRLQRQAESCESGAVIVP